MAGIVVSVGAFVEVSVGFSVGSAVDVAVEVGVSDDVAVALASAATVSRPESASFGS